MPLVQLSTPLLASILRFLDQRQHARCARVCKTFADVCQLSISTCPLFDMKNLIPFHINAPGKNARRITKYFNQWTVEAHLHSDLPEMASFREISQLPRLLTISSDIRYHFYMEHILKLCKDTLQHLKICIDGSMLCKQVEELTHLKTLDLSCTPHMYRDNGFIHLTQLTTLQIQSEHAGRYEYEDEQPQLIALPSSLTELTLHSVDHSLEPLFQCTSLRKLKLTNVTDDLKDLCRLTRLEWLSLSQSGHLSYDEFKTLLECLPHLHSLFLEAEQLVVNYESSLAVGLLNGRHFRQLHITQKDTLGCSWKELIPPLLSGLPLEFKWFATHWWWHDGAVKCVRKTIEKLKLKHYMVSSEPCESITVTYYLPK